MLTKIKVFAYTQKDPGSAFNSPCNSKIFDVGVGFDIFCETGYKWGTKYSSLRYAELPF